MNQAPAAHQHEVLDALAHAEAHALRFLGLPSTKIYPNFEALRAECDDVGRSNGYEVTIKRTKAHSKQLWCGRSGKPDMKNKGHVDKSKLRDTGSKKIECPFELKAVELKDEKTGEWTNQWRLSVVEAEHNHDGIDAAGLARHRRAALTQHQQENINVLIDGGIKTKYIKINNLIAPLGEDGVRINLTSGDISNIRKKRRREGLKGLTPIMALLKTLHVGTYFFNYEKNDETNELERLYVACLDAVCLYRNNPYVILADCTYKTNNADMPLFNICGINGNKNIIQIAIVYLRQEREVDYDWALQQHRYMMTEHNIPEPTITVTDRDLQLMKSFEKNFPSPTTNHLLCRWHIGKNLQANCPKWFPGKAYEEYFNNYTHKKAKRHTKLWNDFNEDWKKLHESTTLETYNSILANMTAKYPKEAIDYIRDVWLVWKEKFIRYWTNQVLNFGVLVTSGCEGCHTHLKELFGCSQNDLFGSFEKLQLFWISQTQKFNELKALELGKIRHRQAISLFSIVQTKIWDKGLDKVLAEMGKIPRIGPPLPVIHSSVCGCPITKSEGIPCLHKVYEIQNSGGLLKVEDFHPFWQYTAPNPVAPQYLHENPPGSPSGGDSDDQRSLATLQEEEDNESVEEEELDFVLPPSKKQKKKGRPQIHQSSRAVQSSINRRNILAASGPSSTRRNPSAWEYDSPFSSSAPAALPRGVVITRGRGRGGSSISSTSTSMRATRSSARRQELTMSSTRLGLIRSDAQTVDRYEPGTAPSRQYNATNFGTLDADLTTENESNEIEVVNLAGSDDELEIGPPTSPVSVYDWSEDPAAWLDQFENDEEMVV